MALGAPGGVKIVTLALRDPFWLSFGSFSLPFGSLLVPFGVSFGRSGLILPRDGT